MQYSLKKQWTGLTGFFRIHRIKTNSKLNPVNPEKSC
jgi:hypothetical protein